MSRNIALILAGGRGSRMNSSSPKQYMLLGGRPVLTYSLSVFDASPLVSDIILVTGKDDITYCKEEIVQAFGFRKVREVTAGGDTRSASVFAGIKAARALLKEEEGDAFLLIQDSARPFTTPDVMERCLDSARRWGSGVAGIPVKDTIRECDEEGRSLATPDRSRLWAVQTPQVFSFDLISRAYTKVFQDVKTLGPQVLEALTDDASALEYALGVRTRMVPASGLNFKITSPEDMALAESILTLDTLRGDVVD